MGRRIPRLRRVSSPAAETDGLKSKRRRTRPDTSDNSTLETGGFVTDRFMSPDDQNDYLGSETEESITDRPASPDDQNGSLDSNTDESTTDRSTRPDDQNDAQGPKTGEATTEPSEEITTPGQNFAFLNLPNEVRIMIYRQLLVSSTSIGNLGELLGIRPSMLPRGQFDTAILRVCRQTYFEGHSVLYGQNAFLFEHGHEVVLFNGSIFRLSSEDIPLSRRRGRLASLGLIIIRLRGRNSIWHSQTTPLTDVRANAWLASRWNHIFDLESTRNLYHFPELRELTIDFTEWRLSDTDEIAVRTFIKKFGKCNHIKRLTTRGMSNQKNLDALRHGILKNGGVLIALDGSGTEVAKMVAPG
ncbi:MAG: hypothetical protein LQ351_005312 [Letrouitia transgressa]|nr:MAG: hypothetical protein LQ351_005312 [Letrouitia transgressa]